FVPRRHAQHSAESLLRLHLQRAPHPDRRRSFLSVLRMAPEPDHRRRRDELEFGFRDRQRAAASTGSPLGGSSAPSLDVSLSRLRRTSSGIARRSARSTMFIVLVCALIAKLAQSIFAP